jgi:quinoprotein glucose dehydrogenase
MRSHCCLIALLATFICSAISLAVPPDAAPPSPDVPQIAAASDEAEKAIKSFRVPQGLEVRLFAAEPDVANPVAFTIANDGKVYVCESFRQGKGIEDNRGHAEWLDDDLAAQTVADRLAYIRKHLKDKADDYTKYDDRIRLIEDTNGDGRADKATVFADHFNSIVEGTGAGVLVRGKDVYFTCIPNLWLLRDDDGNGQAEVRQSLSSGYGVRFAFRGHDMHGLIIGPDGKLYFSIGDRGLNVKQGDNHFVNPESGAVLRCNLDGSELEMIHTGLRNPQELAFDDYGNLFTGDNNSDSGDQARWTMIAEGGDTGWRMYYQYLPDRGPFNREKIWHTQHEGQPAYIIPPIAAGFVSGPSGLAFYPGTGLPEHYKDRFFLCDFRGGPANSGVRTFRVRPKGAFFELADQEETLWSILATDVAFGPDGALYVSDWINGWNGEGKGRIYKYVDPTQESSPVVQEVKKLLAEGFSQRSVEELVSLISHADRRVRQEAQFALVDKNAIKELANVAASTDAKQLARIHAIWGLGMLAQVPKQLDYKLHPVLKLLDDSDPEVRAQATKILGDRQFDCAYEPLIAMLDDPSARVQYFAAQGLGKFGRRDAIPALVNRLAQNADEDPALRHACIMGLAGSAKDARLVELAKHESPSVRIAAAVALRRHRSADVATFLNDSEPKVVVEAARAIHDLPLTAAFPQLAALISKITTDDALLRRILNANYRLGGPEQALAIAEYAARGDAPKHLRLEALAMLEAWDKPSPKDRVLGDWRPLPDRSEMPAVAALKQYLPGILIGDDAIRTAAAKTATKLGVKEIGPALVELLTVKTNAPGTRAEALTALVALQDAKAEELLTAALSDNSAEVRSAARNAVVKLRPADALPLLEEAALNGEQFERQAALATLALLPAAGTDAVIAKALDQLLAGETPAGTRLDVIEAAAKRTDAAIEAKLKQYQAAKPSDRPLSAYSETLAGGNAERGRKLFLEKSQLSCVRCHKVGETGGDVGPVLSKIGGEKNREYLLESIVTPSKAIAKGFDTAVIVNDEGQIVSGIVKQEDAKELRLMTPEGKLLTIPKDTIEERSIGKSAMPEDLLKHLSKPELRDLVEFLSTLR